MCVADGWQPAPDSQVSVRPLHLTYYTWRTRQWLMLQWQVSASCFAILDQGLPRLLQVLDSGSLLWFKLQSDFTHFTWQGFRNGALSISTLPSSKPFVIANAHPSPVTHLFVPTLGNTNLVEEDDEVQERSVLVCSGSADGTIHLWMVSRVPDIDGCPIQQLMTCQHHTSQICMITQPSLHDCDERGVQAPFIVFATSDRMLGLIKLPQLDSYAGHKKITPVLLGPHAARVTAVAWQQSSARLFVMCEGHELAVWSLAECAATSGFVAITDRMMHLWDSVMAEQLCTDVDTILCTKPSSTPSPISDTPDEGYTSMKWLELRPVRMGVVSGLDTAGCAMVFGIKRLAAELHKMLKGKQESGASADRHMSSFAFMAVSYLVIWGHDSISDELKTRVSPFLMPTPALLYGMRGHGGVVTYLTPSANQAYGHGRWKFSPYMTSVQALSLVSMARLLLELGCDNQMCVDLITQACVLLPETMPGFVAPSLSLLARYWEDTWESLQDAARSLLSAAINRMSPAERSSCVTLWQLRMTTTDLSVPKGVAVVILGIMGCLFPDSLDTALTAQIVAALLTNVHQHTMQSALAADILSRGFVSFRKHINDIHELIYVLFHYCADGDAKRPSFGERVRSALVLISAAVPQPFLEVMAQIGSDVDRLMAHKVLTIQLLKSVITKFPSHFEPHIPVVVEHLMGLLNPGIPARRERCLRACTVVLRTMCHKYQFISFHQDSQKYAVGTPGGTVVVYDLRTATKWRILQGQPGPILAVTSTNHAYNLAPVSFIDLWLLQVAFDPSGRKICSYSTAADTICVWQAGSYGMFEMFGLTGSCLSQSNTPQLPFNTSHAPSLVWDTSGAAVCLLQNGHRVFTHRAG